MDDETWGKVVKVVAPGIRKMKVINVAFVLPILFSIYLTMYVCTGIWPKIEFPDYEVAGFQPQTAAIPYLDLWYPHALFEPNNDICMPITRDDINRA